MSETLTRTIPFIEARHKGRKQRPKTIMIRLSETTSDRGAALGIANYWHSPSSPLESCHYVVDSELTFQCVPVNRVSYSSKLVERGVVSVNVCAPPTFDVGFWKDQDYANVLDNAAKLVAYLCKTHNIPVRGVDLLDTRRLFSRGGIMVNVRGAWPTNDFLLAVAEYKNEGGA
jgi:N-acetylmuramoyl-L-alanine amidase CwlA